MGIGIYNIRIFIIILAFYVETTITNPGSVEFRWDSAGDRLFKCPRGIDGYSDVDCREVEGIGGVNYS